MEKIMMFDKKGNWDESLFYEIAKDNDGDKVLILHLLTSRVTSSELYKYWGFRNFDNLEIGKLKDLLEWGDILYGISLRISDMYDDDELSVFAEPLPVYEMVNDLLEEYNGVTRLWLASITEDTECGLYYGL